MEGNKVNVAFFIERGRQRDGDGNALPREVLAVFVDTGNADHKECYSHEGQHATCDVEWVAEDCRPATYEEFRDLYLEMTRIGGYDLLVLDADLWIHKSLDYLKAREEYFRGERDAKPTAA